MDEVSKHMDKNHKTQAILSPFYVNRMHVV